jgi:hypothetical protein
MDNQFVASDWRPHEKATLRGFFTLRLPSGMIVRELTLHEKGDKRWVGLPARPRLDEGGRHRQDPTTSRGQWDPVIEIPDRDRRDKFTEEALVALDRLREGRR